MGLLRHLRGALGMAASWAVTWSVGWTAFMILWRTVGPAPGIPDGEWGDLVRIWMGFFGLAGVWAGLAFSLVLATAERRTSFDRLRAVRVALWGAAAGLSFSVAVGMGWFAAFGARYTIGLGEIISTGIAGTVSALAMLALARRATSPLPAELSPGSPLGDSAAREQAAETARRAT